MKKTKRRKKKWTKRRRKRKRGDEDEGVPTQTLPRKQPGNLEAFQRERKRRKGQNLACFL